METDPKPREPGTSRPSSVPDITQPWPAKSQLLPFGAVHPTTPVVLLPTCNLSTAVRLHPVRVTLEPTAPDNSEILSITGIVEQGEELPEGALPPKAEFVSEIALLVLLPIYITALKTKSPIKTRRSAYSTTPCPLSPLFPLLENLSEKAVIKEIFLSTSITIDFLYYHLRSPKLRPCSIYRFIFNGRKID